MFLTTHIFPASAATTQRLEAVMMQKIEEQMPDKMTISITGNEATHSKSLLSACGSYAPETRKVASDAASG